ncbi:MAG: hypothetical protein H6834_10235 [Planctomycetes bacterium]|nr:hypothetical protein [Planctomycetota bacterium]
MRLALVTTLVLGCSVLAQDPPVPPGGFPILHDADVPITYSDGYRTLCDVRYPAVLAPNDGWPCLVVVHGGGGSRNTPWVRQEAEAMAHEGYLTLTYDTGGEGATQHLNTPFERSDAQRVTDLAEILHLVDARLGTLFDLDRIAVKGHSGGGKHALWAAAYSERMLIHPGLVSTMPRIRAVHVDAQVLNQVEDLVPGGEFVQADWAVRAYRSEGPASPAVAMVLALDYMNLRTYFEASPTANLLPLLQTTNVPLLLSNAFDDHAHFVDVNTNAIGTLPANLPIRYLQATGGHGTPDNELEAQLRADMLHRWCDRFLKFERNGIDREPLAEVAVIPGEAREYLDPSSSWLHRRSGVWPIAPSLRLYLREGGRLDPIPPSGVETSPTIVHRVVPGYDVEGFLQDGANPARVLPNMPHVSARFDIDGWPDAIELLGRPTVELDVLTTASNAQLSAALYDVPPSGTPRFITNGVTALRNVAPGRQRLRIELGDVGYVLSAGHTLQLRLENLHLYRQPGNDRFGVVPDFDDVDLTVVIDPSFAPHVDLPLQPVGVSLRPRYQDVSAMGGWSHGIEVHGEATCAGLPYLVLLGLRGSVPEFPFLGTNLPLRIDALTLLALELVNTPAFQGFTGVLDANGNATATVTCPAAFAASTLGMRFTAAALVLEPGNVFSVTPPVEWTIVR